MQYSEQRRQLYRLAVSSKIIQFMIEPKLDITNAALSTTLSLGKEQPKDKLDSQTMDGKKCDGHETFRVGSTSLKIKITSRVFLLADYDAEKRNL